MDDLHAGLLIVLLRVHQFIEREHGHHHLLRQRQPGGVIETDVAAVGDDAIDELELARLERDRAVALVQRLHMLVRQLGDHLVEDVVLVDRDDAQPPAGAAEILGIGVDADRVVRQLAEQRAEVVDERSVHIVRQQHQVGALGLHQVRRSWRSFPCSIAMPVGLPGLTTKNALIFGSSSFLISSSVYWKRFSCGAAMFTTLRS